ncbi:hypothetical protein H2509_20545 [Stappia sp. F7233]|uniref:Uncharacterized protein n=1 Tax=Stappia albiluteola TaxID=2758565 RepID=A0A839AL48_9HYPH|nr:hypothetical protein [Stappia albiluteola]MBA5779527.1 hypothetical protein [Stappia albiluteola]
MLRSDEVLDALHAVLSAAAAASPDVPEIKRNETLDDAFEALGIGASAYVNLVDGDLEKQDVALGAAADGYELAQRATVEIVVQAETDAARRAAIASIAGAMEAAIAADRTLGQTADFCEVTGLRRENLATDGVANVKGAELTLEILFRSDRPF